MERDKSELLLKLARDILESGGSEVDAVKRASLATSLALIYSSYKMVSQMQELISLSERVIEKISDEGNINKMSPRTLVEALKAISDVINKYSNIASSIGKEIDLSEVEASILETMAGSKGSDDGVLGRYTKEEMADKILELAEMMKKIN